jgi:hypothetical protein
MNFAESVKQHILLINPRALCNAQIVEKPKNAQLEMPHFREMNVLNFDIFFDVNLLVRKKMNEELKAKQNDDDVPLISKPKKEVYEEANKRMGQLMLQGWTMLAEYCEGKYWQLN